MNRDRISAIVSELDQLVPTANASVLLTQYGGGPDESMIVATEAGYLRLGVEFLKAASAPSLKDETTAIAVNLEPLVSPESTISFDWFERVESIEQQHKPTRPSLALIGLAIAGGLLVAMLLVGIATTVRWVVQ
jgi:hypothetical protein